MTIRSIKSSDLERAEATNFCPERVAANKTSRSIAKTGTQYDIVQLFPWCSAQLLCGSLLSALVQL